MSNDEISYADYLVKIPTNKRFSSLNLSHSAIIFCFQLFQHFSKKKEVYNPSYKSTIATKSEINKFLNNAQNIKSLKSGELHKLNIEVSTKKLKTNPQRGIF